MALKTRMIDVVGGRRHGERIELSKGLKRVEGLTDGVHETYTLVKKSDGKEFLVYRPSSD